MDKTPVDILTAIPAPYPDVTTRHDGETVEISFLRIRSARMQRLLGKWCKKNYVTFDAHGSFVWDLIDGRNTVSDIITASESHFAGEQEYEERIQRFIMSLHSNKIIKLLIRN